ncbi:MAG: ATP-binding protein [Phormidesmis sp.]
MQTSHRFTATQQVSLTSYQRLRETLVQQAYLFESVVTEAQFLPLFAQPLETSFSEKSIQTAIVVQSVTQQFILMRSPDFNVLLVATPLADSLSSADAVPPASPDQLKHSARHLAQHQFASSYELLSPTQQTLRKSDLIRAAVAKAVDSTVASAASLPAYQIQLSFDRQTIHDFVCQLVPHPSDRESTYLIPDLIPAPTRTPNAMKRQIERHSNHSPKAQTHKEAHKTLKNEEFVLAWTKQLAESPDGLAQSSLANQVQQSLLLNQVITRIRHSLDLPDILETTVAQVREFLSADRLVVYQFEQMEAVNSSSPSSTEPLAVEGIRDPVGEPSLSEPELSEPSLSNRDRTVSQTTTDTTDTPQNSDAVVGRCTHAGHITYESRISETLPSVLNLSETDCFRPTPSILSRYLMGEPVAVDDVERRYAHTPCLLDFLHQAQVKSKIIAPIIVQGQLWGLLIVHQCDRVRHWLETEVLFLQHIAEHLTVAISQAGLYKQLQEQTLSLESCVVERTQNLHDALLAAESANLTKGEFLSTMSHELRTPLTYIIGMSATLLRWSFGELSDRQRSYLNTINHSGEQLLGIINDILEFAKISSGRSFLDISEFSLCALIEVVFEQFQAIADKQGVRLSLSLEVSAKEDSFCADAKRLRQILSNLIHNAIKFTPAGGQVVLRVRCEDQVGIFQVEDTGIGIPEAQQGMLFEKFKQLESPFQRQYSGTGLGLAMTKRLVELHGGTIQVKSKVDKGSLFSVRLPAQPSQSTSTRYQVPTTLAAGTKRILLLESQENSAAIICDLLTADGYEVIWHPESETILTQVESLRPAMLIADLSILSNNSSNLKDIQLAITAMGAKVIALLDKPSSESSHMAHHDTLSKPIDPKQLLKKVRYLMLGKE